MCIPSGDCCTMLGLVHEMINQHARHAAKQYTETDSEEGEAGLRDAEGIRWACEDVREGGEEEEEHAECKSRV